MWNSNRFTFALCLNRFHLSISPGLLIFNHSHKLYAYLMCLSPSKYSYTQIQYSSFILYTCWSYNIQILNVICCCFSLLQNPDVIIVLNSTEFYTYFCIWYLATYILLKLFDLPVKHFLRNFVQSYNF